MLFFMVTILLFTVVVIVLMVFMDINHLLTYKDFFGRELYLDVIKEILFAFVVIITVSLMIVNRYSQNLKTILSIQLQAMEKISRGEYNAHVPVISNDEFGLIAAKTNDMANGLKERDECQISFGKYVTPEVSEKILRGEISAEGELTEATILFCDLRGYTLFVERKEPKEVVKFLNTYFSEMELAVRQHNGIVLQYIGDEIEAVFGFPVQEDAHCEMAVETALQMRRRLQVLNEKRRSIGESPIQHGIGIHTGTVLAGSVGSPERLVYAMVGDAVNLASRIQDLNKQFGTDILISGTTRERLSDGEYGIVGLGETEIRGKKEKVEVFKIL
jgi:class 3 adenylate cyclase